MFRKFRGKKDVTQERAAEGSSTRDSNEDTARRPPSPMDIDSITPHNAVPLTEPINSAVATTRYTSNMAGEPNEDNDHVVHYSQGHEEKPLHPNILAVEHGERGSAEDKWAKDDGPQDEIIIHRELSEKEKALERRLNELDNTIKMYEKEIESVAAKNEAFDKVNAEDRREGDREMRQLTHQQELLSSIRAFNTKESTLDAQSLIQPFEDINILIADFAFEVLRTLPVSAEDIVLQDEDYRAMQAMAETHKLKPALDFMSKIPELTPMDITDPFVRHIVCRRVWSTIFTPFVPGISPVKEAIWRDIYKGIHSQESQEQCGNWRSITYKHVAQFQDEKVLEDAAKEVLDDLSNMITSLCRGEKITLPDTFLQAVLKIFRSARDVQAKAKGEYISIDYLPRLVQPGEPFGDKAMTSHQGGKGKAKWVLLTVGFGLWAEKNVVNSDGTVRAQGDTVVKTLVVSDNWDPNV